ncbi:hypothetical protein GDO81_023588 [Engystomops pustulosus]|uniref:Olfactory receptor n=1 Tax=Engystomops pustulosus TaxID=76066 RepID=A0AAV6ZN17_ENGPU|nr:hypothetical protein GDO81_023588 [Engystomops pustulosus]
MHTNLTVVTEFLLLGFQGNRLFRNVLFLVFLVVFSTTICGNLLIIVLVSTSRNLHTPMYFFISQLSVGDIVLTLDIVPILLRILLHNGSVISFIGCMSQFYFFSVSGIYECLLLTVMSYDRYVAICNPLHYTSVMTMSYCMKLDVGCWFLATLFSLIDNIITSTLTYCGGNIIDHFFCDLLPLEGAACSDTSFIDIIMYVQSLPLVIIPTVVIIQSYVRIVFAVLRIPSSTGRQKAFSTCSSHLIVVSIFYWSLFSVYVVPTNGQSSTISKILSLLYTVLTPLINPIIYSLRNKDIRKAVQELLHKCKCN